VRRLVAVVALFGALVANPATFLPGLQTSLAIAAMVLLATAAASLLLRPAAAAPAAADHPPSGRRDRPTVDEAWTAAY
jgi:hypothetical protein